MLLFIFALFPPPRLA